MKFDESIRVKYRGIYCTLGEALKIIQPGEIIEHVPFEYFDNITLHLIKERKHPEYEYGCDRRYGDWRYILYGIRDYDYVPY